MDGIACSDYAYSYPDVVMSPDDPEPGGIYVLDRADQEDDPWSGSTLNNRFSSGVRMRGERPRAPGRGRSEGFAPRAYAEGLPARYPGRSQRWGRPALDDAMWDERPRAFRPNAANQYAQLFVPPELHDRRFLAYPVYAPSRAVSVLDREPFSASGPDAVPIQPAPEGPGARPAPAAGGSPGRAGAGRRITLALPSLSTLLCVALLLLVVLLAMRIARELGLRAGPRPAENSAAGPGGAPPGHIERALQRIASSQAAIQAEQGALRLAIASAAAKTQ